MDEIPVTLFLIRSQSRPRIAIICTEPHLAKWIQKIKDRGEQPEICPVSKEDLIRMIRPSHLLN